AEDGHGNRVRTRRQAGVKDSLLRFEGGRVFIQIGGNDVVVDADLHVPQIVLRFVEVSHLRAVEAEAGAGAGGAREGLGALKAPAIDVVGPDTVVGDARI